MNSKYIDFKHQINVGFRKRIFNIKDISEEFEESDSSLSSSDSYNSDESSILSVDYSSDFNEVEKVIEEYYFNKIKWSSCKKQGYNRGNDSLKTKSVLLTDANVGDESIETFDTATQVKEIDLKVQKRTNYVGIFKSRTEYDIGLQNIKVTLESFLSKLRFNEEMNDNLYNSTYLLPKLSFRRITGFCKDHVSNKVIKYKNILLNLWKKENVKNIYTYSPFKAILLVNLETSQIIKSNNQARALFCGDLETKYLNDYLMGYYKYLKDLDYFINDDGFIQYIPANVIICKDSRNSNFVASLQIHKYNSAIDKLELLIILEPVQTINSYCLMRNKQLVGYNKNFLDMVKFCNKVCQEFYWYNSEKDDETCKCVYVTRDQNFNFTNFENYSSFLNCTSSFEHIQNFDLLKHIHKYVNGNFKFSEPMLDEFEFCSFCFFYNASHLMVISEEGYILDMDPSFLIVLSYTKEEICRLKLKDILKIDDKDPLTIIRGAPKFHNGVFYSPKKDGVEGIFCNLTVCKGNNKLLHYVWVIRRSNIQTESNLNLTVNENLQNILSLKTFVCSNYYIDYKKRMEVDFENITDEVVLSKFQENLSEVFEETSQEKIQYSYSEVFEDSQKRHSENYTELIDENIQFEDFEKYSDMFSKYDQANDEYNEHNYLLNEQDEEEANYFDILSKDEDAIAFSTRTKRKEKFHTVAAISLSKLFESSSLLMNNERKCVSKCEKESEIKQPTDLFFDNYEPLNIIGKGAFGYVKMSQSVSSNKQFVVKFIRKCKLNMEHMIKVPLEEVNQFKRRLALKDGYEPITKDKIFVQDDIKYILVPKEIWMLCCLNHENIVGLHDWFEGSEHYQLVMPKHGIGMDLFEFIERAPPLEEPLASVIFRQLVDAVNYLHILSIAHRDIKDENIILDDQFKIKLIDFGAAVKVGSDQKFKTFCGTIEFCSPEILLGQEYNCFYADVWSMGITLYTVMFGENPFSHCEETIKAVLKPPKNISEDLKHILSKLIEPDPEKRIKLSTLMQMSWLHQQVDINNYVFGEMIHNTEFIGNTSLDYRKYSNDSEANLSVESIEKNISERI